MLDGYGPAVAGLEAEVAAIEDGVFEDTHDLSPRIYRLSRTVVAVHRRLDPLVGAIERLLRDEIGGSIGVEMRGARGYLLEIQDRAQRLAERLLDLRELLNGLLSVNLSLTGIRINDRRQDIVQQISAWAAILAVPNLVTGVFGMNVGVMQDLDWTWGFPLAGGLVALVCGAMYVGFRRSGWL